MTLSRTSAIVFTVAYAIIYVASVQYNFALFTYHPELNRFGPLVEKSIQGPAMYWYGWMATSGLGALVVTAISSFVPMKLQSYLAWAVPIAAMLAIVYIDRMYFLR